jgi:hypothetical protein
MTYECLLRIDKLFFTPYDVAHALDIKLASAEVLCTRYVKRRLLTRLKRGLYAKSETLAHLSQTDLFRIANILQVPSYISLVTALSYYGMASQASRGLLESISIKRTRAFEMGSPSFHYIKIRPDLYGGFEKRDGFFIALPEKAVLDCLYLASMGRYVLDGASLDLTQVDGETFADLSSNYPLKARKFFERFYAKAKRP